MEQQAKDGSDRQGETGKRHAGTAQLGRAHRADKGQFSHCRLAGLNSED
jgi:hypothetical protein